MAGLMNPRIDDTAQLVSVKKVKVWGPINWGPWPAAGAAAVPGEPYETAVWFTAVVSQVNPGAAGPELVTGIGSEGVYLNGASPPLTWDLTATRIGTAGSFQQGGATVAAWATIAYSDGGASSYAWTLPVLIQ